MTHGFAAMATHARALAGVATLLLASSCQGGAVAFCEARERETCELELRCCAPDERIDATNAYTSTEGECIERATSTCRAQNAAIDDSIALGRTALVPANIDTCLAALRAAAEACDRTLAQAAHLACDNVTDGLVAGGDACALSSECRAGGACDLAGSRDVDEELHAPAGECIEPPAEGDPCPDGVCAEGLFCNNNDCDRLPGDGDPCNVECAAGLHCDAATFTCAPLGLDGVECTTPSECIAGVCAPSSPTATVFVCGGADAGACRGR